MIPKKSNALNSKHNTFNYHNVLFLFLFLYIPKAPFAIGMLALILKGVRDPSLTVSQSFTVLPTLLLHHTAANALKGKEYWKIAHVLKKKKRMESN